METSLGRSSDKVDLLALSTMDQRNSFEVLDEEYYFQLKCVISVIVICAIHSTEIKNY